MNETRDHSMFPFRRFSTPASTGCLALAVAAARTSATHNVERQADAALGQRATASVSRQAKSNRCDISFEKLDELLRLGPTGPLFPDQTPALWLIDVRERAEVAREGKIPNSVNLPLCELKKALLSDCEDFDLTYGFSKPEKHHENIIFYSINHVKSATAVEIAHRLGYRKARHYSGGYDDWITKQIDHMNIRAYHEE